MGGGGLNFGCQPVMAFGSTGVEFIHEGVGDVWAFSLEWCLEAIKNI